MLLSGLEPLSEKWRSFNWEVREVDGHNLNKIAKVLERVPFKAGKPSLLIAHTTKGKGISFMEGEAKYHALSLTREQYEQAVMELGPLDEERSS